jgi:ubiquinone/menaquinone biosynthesis C-methylase UbiE
MDWVCGTKKISRYRKELLSGVRGKILEIGFGTGLNLEHYPTSVSAITVIDPNPGMKKKALKRIANSGIKVGHHLLTAEKLPFENQTFDSVVATFTLCSIPDVELALWEIHRVLKKEGRFYFLEHGLSPDPPVQKKQNRWTPWQKRLADGCHLNRDMAALVSGAGFRFIDLKKFYHPSIPKPFGFLYQGIAVKEGG